MSDGSSADPSLEQRVETLETRLADLEDGSRTTTATGDFWALETLRGQTDPTHGAVLWTGIVPTEGGTVEWQMARSATALKELEDTTELSERLTALSHPIRISLLLEVLRGTCRLTALAEALDLASTGQLYHHVKTLSAAGWLRSAGRGQVTVPEERTVPLLVIMGAAR